MIPYLLAVVGGYLVAQSRKSEKFADGGNISETATTILSQLGGAGKLHAITGAHTFVDLKNGLAFRLPNPRANWVKIILNGKDLYDIEVGRIRGTTYKVVAKGEDIYFDEMKPFIEQATGLTLTMPRVRFDDGGMTDVAEDYFTYETDEDYYRNKGASSYYEYNVLDVFGIDEKGEKFWHQVKSKEAYDKIKNDPKLKITKLRPMVAEYDIMDYYEPEDVEEAYEYEDYEEYKKGGKVGVTRASSLKRKFVWVQEQGAKGGSWSSTGVFGQKGFEEIFKEISDDKEFKLVVDEESVKTFERKADGYRISFKLKAVYAKGGKVKKRAKFADKVDSIADRLDGEKVPKKLQKDYGKRYNRAEAEEAGRRIAGSQLKKLRDGR